MFSKRIPVGEKLLASPEDLGVWQIAPSLQRSASHEIAQYLFRARAFLCILFFGDGARLAAQLEPETYVPSAHQGLCRWRHRLPQDSRSRLWEPQLHSAQRAPSISVSSALPPEHHPPPAPGRLPPTTGLRASRIATSAKIQNKSSNQWPFQNVQPPGNLLDARAGRFAAAPAVHLGLVGLAPAPGICVRRGRRRSGNAHGHNRARWNILTAVEIHALFLSARS